MSSVSGWTRPNNSLLRSFEQANKSGIDQQVDFELPVNDSDWSVLTNHKYTDHNDGTTTVITSGVIMLFGENVGVLKYDTADTQNGAWNFTGTYYVDLKTGDTPAVMDPLYWDAAAEKLTTTVGAGPNKFAGYAKSTADVLTAGNTKYYPSSTFVKVELVMSQP